MPFTITNTPPSTTSQVTVAFSGLIVLRPGANDTCKIGVNRFDRAHLFQVVMIVSKPDRPPVAVPLITGPLTAGFVIRASDQDAENGDFKAFARDPFDRTLPRSHDLDHRWAINFRDLHLDLQTNEGAEPAGTLTTGVLYTPNLTDRNLFPRLIRQGSPDFNLNQIASNLAVSIDLPAGKTIKFEWSDLGESLDLELPRQGDPDGTKYTLCFINEPPSLNVEPHDEFALYYKVLKSGGGSIPGEQRFELEVDSAVRTDEIPCMPVLVNR
jgi:hypothetical protein